MRPSLRPHEHHQQGRTNHFPVPFPWSSGEQNKNLHVACRDNSFGINIAKRKKKNGQYQTAILHTIQSNSCYRNHRGLYTPYNGINLNVMFCLLRWRQPDSAVGIATRYGLDGPGIESRWGVRFSAPVQTCPGAQPVSYTMGTGSFPGVNRAGRGVDHPPHLVPKLEKE